MEQTSASCVNLELMIHEYATLLCTMYTFRLKLFNNSNKHSFSA